MVKVNRSEEIRRFILEEVAQHPADTVRRTAERFGLSRQAVSRHLALLVKEGSLVQSGKTRARTYGLATLVKWASTYTLPGAGEDVVWTNDVAPRLDSVPKNVRDIWQYAFTEIYNNALEHSGGTEILVSLEQTAASTSILVKDNGVGIFHKIQDAMNLLDERHAVLELVKGKLTTDPHHHSGEGIFFTSRMMDRFRILSGSVYFGHNFGTTEDWILQNQGPAKGTCVEMSLSNHAARTMKDVFDSFGSDSEDYGFTKTVVPVELAIMGRDALISRSQAKRLLARVEIFRTVVFDFAGVNEIGQAFADEIFRVFPLSHPNVQILDIRASDGVRRMIARARERPDLRES